MASNGYVRRICSECIFYRDEKDDSGHCILCSENTYKADSMVWISAYDCAKNTKIKEKYNEDCEHYRNAKEVRNQIRKELKIKCRGQIL